MSCSPSTAGPSGDSPPVPGEGTVGTAGPGPWLVPLPELAGLPSLLPGAAGVPGESPGLPGLPGLLPGGVATGGLPTCGLPTGGLFTGELFTGHGGVAGCAGTAGIAGNTPGTAGVAGIAGIAGDPHGRSTGAATGGLFPGGLFPGGLALWFEAAFTEVAAAVARVDPAVWLRVVATLLAFTGLAGLPAAPGLPTASVLPAGRRFPGGAGALRVRVRSSQDGVSCQEERQGSGGPARPRLPRWLTWRQPHPLRQRQERQVVRVGWSAH